MVSVGRTFGPGPQQALWSITHPRRRNALRARLPGNLEAPCQAASDPQADRPALTTQQGSPPAPALPGGQGGCSQSWAVDGGHRGRPTARLAFQSSSQARRSSNRIFSGQPRSADPFGTCGQSRPKYATVCFCAGRLRRPGRQSPVLGSSAEAPPCGTGFLLRPSLSLWE